MICNDCTRKYSAILAVFTILIVISSYSDIYGVTGSADKDYKNGNQNNAEYPIGNKTLVRQDNRTDNSTANNDINLRESADGGNTFIDLKNRTLSNIQYSYPKVLDSDLKVERVTSGIKFPTHMAFLGQDDILVLEKNDGAVKRVTNGFNTK